MVYFKVIIMLLTFVSGIHNKMHSVEEIEYSRWNPLLMRRSFRPYLSEKEIFKDTTHYFNEFADYYNYKFKNETGRKTAFSHFTESLKKTSELNERSSTAVFKVNEFSIYSLEKFLSLYTGFNDTNLNMTGARSFNIVVDHLPKELDFRGTWVESGAYDQGECLSSYVFSAIQNIEAQLMKSFKYKRSLSVQYAFECEREGNCIDGGLPHLVMEALMKTGVLEADKYNPYLNSSHEKSCKANETAVAKVTGYYIFTVEREEYLKNALALYGPLSIAINVGDELKNYYSGVLDPTDCNNKPNHAVLLVGYGTTNEDGIKYWIIRNSWGSAWGENGFFRLIRGKWACGIGSYTATATVEISTEAGWNGTVTPIVLPDSVKPRSVTVDVKPEYSEYYSSLDKDHTAEVELPPNNINSNESVIRNLDYLKNKFQKFEKNTTNLLSLEIVESETKIIKLEKPKLNTITSIATQPTEQASSTDNVEPKKSKSTQIEKPTTSESESKDQKIVRINVGNSSTITSTTKDQTPTQTEIEEPKPKYHTTTETYAEKPSTKQVKVEDQITTTAKAEKSYTRQNNPNDQKSIQTKAETLSTEESTPNEQKANATKANIPLSSKPENLVTLEPPTDTVGYENKLWKQIESISLLLNQSKTEPNGLKLEKPNLRVSNNLNGSMQTQSKTNAGVTKKPKLKKMRPRRRKNNNALRAVFGSLLDFSIVTEVINLKTTAREYMMAFNKPVTQISDGPKDYF